MAAPNLDSKLALLKLRRYTRHTLQKLRMHTWAKPLGTQLETVGKEVDTALVSEAKLVDAVEDAETVLDIADLDLNEYARKVDVFAKSYYTGPNLRDVRDALFGPGVTLTQFNKPLMGQQLRKMRDWPKYLATLRPTEFAPMITKIETALKTADAAIAALTQTEIDLTGFRSATHAPLVVKVANLFQDIWTEAVKKSRETGVPAESLGLFLSVRKNRPPLTLARARAEVTAAEQDLRDAKQELAELEAEAAAEDQADKAREILEGRIADLQKGQKEAQAQIDALQAELARDK